MNTKLTDMQRQALDFIIENPPDGSSLRVYAIAAGFPSHQAFIGAVMALYMKGYLIPIEKDGG